jgi:hypothetical protein
VKRLPNPDAKGCASMWNDPCATLQKFPLCADFLLNEEFEEGGERKVGVLIIRAEDGAFRVTAKEPSQCQMISYRASTWLEILVNLEALLGAARAPWVVDQFEQARSQPRKKRGG